MKTKGRVLIFTGDGKGKTTAALGMALRASGHGMRTLVLHFMKADDTVGELTGLRYLPGVEAIQMGRGFVPPPTNPSFPEHRQAACHGLEKAAEALCSKQYDLVILDEIITAMDRGLVTENQIMELIVKSDDISCLVLTGRGATQHLIDKADTVTEMRNLKHGLTQGIAAQKGVEY
ncbi:MAG TPA: cob(I)yrinic acid a,c-diamide adenosyltransferase [Thermodesulfobacteriota bacterium]|nr:cob(I)yrinic acid a,c-diamide adenosyltransferase [Thermodesulfobacteriota bacterium]